MLSDASNAPEALVRIQGYLVTNLLDKVKEFQKLNNDKFKVLGLKIWSDGSIQGYTAAMKEKYKDADTTGTLNFSQEQLTKMVEEARKEGFKFPFMQMEIKPLKRLSTHLRKRKSYIQAMILALESNMPPLWIRNNGNGL